MEPFRKRLAMLVVCVLVAAALAACGNQRDDVTAGLPTAEHEYDGPLHVAEGRYGAAGQVVECRHGPTLGGFDRAAVRSEGATSPTVKRALETAYSEGMFLELPDVELSVARTEDDRVLLTYTDDAGVPRIAVVFHDGEGTEGAGGDGWYRESWARCDLSEFPQHVAESDGVQIWTGAAGEPALTTRIESSRGDPHCGWEGMMFLSLDGGLDTGALYVQDPPRDIAPFMQGVYRADVKLPDDAVATPYSRDGNRLWLSPDRRYAYIGDRNSVAAWPRTKPGFGCV